MSNLVTQALFMNMKGLSHRVGDLIEFLVIASVILLSGCNTEVNTEDTPSPIPSDTYFSFAVTENSHNHVGSRLLFLDFQETANTAVIQNNIVISPKSSAGAFTIDGDATEWSIANLTTVNGLVQNNYPLSEFIDAVPTYITIGSSWDDSYIYFLVQWVDAGHTNSSKYKKWIYGDQGNLETGWNPLNHIGVMAGAPNENTVNNTHILAGKESEDRVFFMFPITDSENNFSNGGLGCAAYCHANLIDDNPAQNYTGSEVAAMHTNINGDTADIWHWKSSRTHPSGYADDKYINYAQGSDSGRRSDAGTSAYSTNVLNAGNPTSWHRDRLANTDDFLMAVDAIPYDGAPAPGNQIPANISDIPTLSRADVEAQASYNPATNQWTLELRRLRNTGNADDRQFPLGTGASAPTTAAPTAGVIATGANLYGSSGKGCDSCHGAAGIGSNNGLTWSFPRIQRASGSLILKAVQNVTEMQSLSVSETEAEHIAAYLQDQETFVTTSRLTVNITGGAGSANIVTSTPGGIDCPVSCAFDYINTATISLSAAYQHGYTFNGWSGAGCSGNLNCSVDMSTDQTVTAAFTANPTTYRLTIVDDGNGTVNVSPVGITCGANCYDITAGNAVTLVAQPNTGFQFDGWLVAETGCTGINDCIFTITADTNVTANFVPITNPDCSNQGFIFDTGGSIGNSYALQMVIDDGTAGNPIDIAFVPGSATDFLVISQNGTVYYFDGGCTPVNSVDISGAIGVVDGGEQGLLNIEFHPDFDFATNKLVFFYHTSIGSTVNSVSRMTADFIGGTLALTNPVKVIDFRKANSAVASNHNGGGMVFAPDGTLLASIGDGGNSSSTAQDNARLLGKVIRIIPEVTACTDCYTIPSGNMFPDTNPKCTDITQSAAACPEIVAMGLRNPFRMSIAGNIVYLGDVGSGNEEINSFDYTSVDTLSPVNFGWPTHDGYVASSSIPGYRNPIVYYNRSGTVADNFRAEDPDGTETGNASIMIGDVSTGSQYGGALNNKLFFAEFYDGFMRAVGVDSNGDITDADGVPGMHLKHHGRITSMVEGPDGYMYITTLYGPGMVYRLVKP